MLRTLLNGLPNVVLFRYNASPCLFSTSHLTKYSTIGAGPGIASLNKRKNETEEVTRARLLYQSRKRGTLENGLILSLFADKYLAKMDTELLHQYDDLINLPENDWDIYYWVVGSRPVPPQFKNRALDLLQNFVKHKFNKNV